MVYLGECYLASGPLAVDYAEALTYFEQAAEKGARHARKGFRKTAYIAGDDFKSGWGVPKDYQKAAELFKLAADCGHDGCAIRIRPLLCIWYWNQSR